MDSLFTQMEEFLRMETEIELGEFAAYYKKVIDKLTVEIESLSRENLLLAKFIVIIVGSNSFERAKRKDQNAKKYKKMSDKCDFWKGALNYRLLKDGLTQEEIDQAVDEISSKAGNQ